MSTNISTNDTLVLNMSERADKGNAQFIITVDGVQVGGTQTVTALQAKGQTQAFTVKGNFGLGNHVVAVKFLSDISAPDRELYFNAFMFDKTYQKVYTNVTGTTAVDAKSLVAPRAVNTVTVNVSEDAWKGDAKFVLLVDGVAVGGTQTVTASHAGGASQNITLTGSFGTGPHAVAIQFINDAYGGAGKDRNLYVNSVTYDGTKTVVQAALYANSTSPTVVVSDVATVGSGAVIVSNPIPPVVSPPPIVTPPVVVPPVVVPDTLVLYVSEDAYLGDAQFSVTLDGKAVGGIQTATGSHNAGGTQAITLSGLFGAGPHSVVVTFLNDASGGDYTLDRNLYVSGMVYDKTYTGVDAALYYTGASSTTIVGRPGAVPVVPLLPSAVLPGTLQLVGVNLAGLEFGGPALPGVLNTDYVEPTHAEIDYYAATGMNVIRLPFDWERLQPVQGGAFDKAYLAMIDDLVAYAGAKGVKVDLDVHNYGSGYGNVIGSAGTPNSSFDDLWSKLATHFAATPNVIFGLMNEPYQQTAADWLTSANGAIAAIRATGASQEILVPGTHVDGGSSWTTTDNASVMDGVIDPKMNFAFEIHQYLDADGSGTSTSVVSPTIGVERLTAVTQWAEATGNRLFLGEFGSGSDAASLAATQNMLTYMSQHTDAWQGATEWGGGPWWGNYGFATDPTAGVSTNQVSLLQTYTPTSTAHS